MLKWFKSHAQGIMRMRIIHSMVEPPIIKGYDDGLKDVYNSLYLDFEFRKRRTIKGDTMHNL